MPYCHSPWTNLDIDPQGYMSPCCKFDYSQYKESQHNIIKHTIDEYINGEVVKQVKADFIKDKWPPGCIRCKIEEQNNIESKRQLDYIRWQEQYDIYTEDQKLITASIAFGNTCNLKCITCGPTASSRWYNESQAINKKTVKANHFYKEDFVENFLAHTPNLSHLDIPGGEPFLSGVKQQKDLLSWYIKNNKAKNISIHYTTNAQLWPDNDWWNLWQHFKEIDIQLSVDGINSRYEYIRFPANWNKFVENCNRYQEAVKINKNIRLSVSHTLSAYNVYYLDEFFTWCKHIGLPRPWVGRVHDPEHMRVSIFPEDIKQDIVQHLLRSEFNDVKTWAKHLDATDDSMNYKDFLTRAKAHDAYRGLSFQKTFPELAELLAY